MKLGYIEYMDCAHFLPGHAKCGTNHGHTYKVEVIISGENKTGMILDFGDMKTIIRNVLAEYDHKSLNDFLEYPSVEIFARCWPGVFVRNGSIRSRFVCGRERGSGRSWSLKISLAALLGGCPTFSFYSATSAPECAIAARLAIGSTCLPPAPAG